MKDQVNRHYFSMFAAVGAVGIISGLTLQNSNPYGGGAQAFRAGAGQGLGQAAEQILQRFLNRLPTLVPRRHSRKSIFGEKLTFVFMIFIDLILLAKLNLMPALGFHLTWF